jgi:hypothetical protein
MGKFAADESLIIMYRAGRKLECLDKESLGSSNVSLHNAYLQLNVSGNEMPRRIFVLKKKGRENGIMRSCIICTLNSVALVRERTVPTERPPLVGEVSANFCG